MPHQAKWLEPDTEDSTSDQETEETFAIRKTTDRSKPIMVEVEVNGKTLQMELDTGASVSLISEQTYLTAWVDSDRPALRQSSKKLQTYTGESIPLKGEIDVKVRAQTKDPTILLPLLVVLYNGEAVASWVETGCAS